MEKRDATAELIWDDALSRVQADLDVGVPGARVRREGHDLWCEIDDHGAGLDDFFEVDAAHDAEAWTHQVAAAYAMLDCVCPRCPAHPAAGHRLVPKLTRKLGAAWACPHENRALVRVGDLATMTGVVR